MNRTDIEWTTFSANPIKYRRKSDGKVVWGCVKTSPGCAHCYSEAIALRFARGKLFNARNMEELEPFLDEAEMRTMALATTIAGVPVSGSRCFVGDMTDIFGEWILDNLLNRLFSSVLEMRSNVTWQLLTKRAKRIRHYLDHRIASRNIHVGVSVEDQERADERIPHLLKTPAAARFLSCEPLLEYLNLSAWFDDGGIDWCVVGGESGPGSRQCHVSWIRSIVRQCQTAGVPVFVKQLGANVIDHDTTAAHTCPEDHCWPDGTKTNGHRVLLRDRKGGDPEEWPEDLRVRQFPAVTKAVPA